MGVDAVIAALASRQHGVVSRAQLVAAGVSADAIRHRVETERLFPLHRGVYRLGPVHTTLTSPMAAVLACGPTAALSHHAAAALHGIRPARGGPIDVTVTKGHARRKRGITIHRARTLATTTLHGIPTTTVAQTLKDLAAVLPPRDLARAVEEAQVPRKLDRESLTRAVDGARGRRGAVALRAATKHEPKFTRSEAERRFLELVRAAGLPEPETNVRVGRYEVDALWRDERLVVEVDGYRFHSTPRAVERDRRKEADLERAGYTVKRVTWRQIAEEREALVARLARSLTAGPESARPPAPAAPLLTAGPASARPPVAAAPRGSPRGRPRS